MMALVFFVALLLAVAQGQFLEHYRHTLPNNSYVYSRDIHIRGGALNCVSGNSTPGSWMYPNRQKVLNEQEQARVGCFYSDKNGVGVMGLYRERLCTNSNGLQGLWSCVAPDSSGEMQSLYIYIGFKRRDNPPGQLNKSVTMNFTLHTEPNASVPEFTISCRTHGGPATEVAWTYNGVKVQELQGFYHETSQLILDTDDSVYDNRLRVRGKRSGTYNCTVGNNIRNYLDYYVKKDEIKVSQTIKVTDEMLEQTLEPSRELLLPNAPPNLMRDDSATNIEHDVSETRHTSSPSCQDKEDGDSTAVIAGCVGGGMFLIIVTQSLAIILLLLRQRARARVSDKKLGAYSKSTVGVNPEHEMMGLQKVGAQQ